MYQLSGSICKCIKMANFSANFRIILFVLLSISFLKFIMETQQLSFFPRFNGSVIGGKRMNLPVNVTNNYGQNTTLTNKMISTGIEPSLCDFQSLRKLSLAPNSSNIPNMEEFCSLFPPEKQYSEQQERKLVSESSRHKLRMDNLKEFCQSEIYTENISKLRTSPKTRVITLFNQYKVFECRVAKTGK